MAAAGLAAAPQRAAAVLQQDWRALVVPATEHPAGQCASTAPAPVAADVAPDVATASRSKAWAVAAHSSRTPAVAASVSRHGPAAAVAATHRARTGPALAAPGARFAKPAAEDAAGRAQRRGSAKPVAPGVPAVGLLREFAQQDAACRVAARQAVARHAAEDVALAGGAALVAAGAPLAAAAAPVAANGPCPRPADGPDHRRLAVDRPSSPPSPRHHAHRPP